MTLDALIDANYDLTFRCNVVLDDPCIWCIPKVQKRLVRLMELVGIKLLTSPGHTRRAKGEAFSFSFVIFSIACMRQWYLKSAFNPETIQLHWTAGPVHLGAFEEAHPILVLCSPHGQQDPKISEQAGHSLSRGQCQQKYLMAGCMEM